MLSKLTLIGLHNYSNGAIWEDIELPEGIEKELLINEILKQNGEFCLIYPDQDFLKLQIKMFFKKWYTSFEKWIYVLNEEYEPLFNVDVRTSFTEEGENHEEGSKSTTASATGTVNGTSTNIESKAAFDSSTFQNTLKDEGTSGTTSTQGSNSSDDTTGDSTHAISTEEYKRGNQGITQSQEMVLAELNVRKFNLYDQIADIFAGEFCITVYM